MSNVTNIHGIPVDNNFHAVAYLCDKVEAGQIEGMITIVEEKDGTYGHCVGEHGTNKLKFARYMRQVADKLEEDFHASQKES